MTACRLCATTVLLQQQQSSLKQRQQLRVGPGERFASIGEAVAAALPGADITVCGGCYPERLVLDKPLTIAAVPGELVKVSWSSSEPYQAAVEVLANGVTLRGLQVRHRSPSIANNAAVRVVGVDAMLEGLDVSSSTGSGVEVEGGAPRLVRCSAHDCERHGFAIFGAR